MQLLTVVTPTLRKQENEKLEVSLGCTAHPVSEQNMTKFPRDSQPVNMALITYTCKEERGEKLHSSVLI